MNTNAAYARFTRLYPMRKTLKFELLPLGKTLEHIQKKGLLNKDEERAEKYRKVKRILDEYHRWFISCALKEVELEGLHDYARSYSSQDGRDKEKQKKLEELKKALRKQIVTSLRKHPGYSTLDKAALFKSGKSENALLADFIKGISEVRLRALGFRHSNEALGMIQDFERFTTYFTGYHEKRKRLYEDEEKSTAIAYRLINENLPRFVDNLQVYRKVALSPIAVSLVSFGEKGDSGEKLQHFFTLEAFNKTLTQDGIDAYNQMIGGFDTGREVQGLNTLIERYNQQLSKEEKGRRIPKFKALYKQILSDRRTALIHKEAFANDQEVLDTLTDIYENQRLRIQAVITLLCDLRNFDTDKVYLKNDRTLSMLSGRMTGSKFKFQEALNHVYEQQYRGRVKPGSEAFLQKRSQYFKGQKSFSIQYVNSCLKKLSNEELSKSFRIEEAYMATFAANGKLVNQIEHNYQQVRNLLLESRYPKHKLAREQEHVDKIRAFMESLKDLLTLIEPLCGSGDEAIKDEKFYGEFYPLWDELEILSPLYTRVRNYFTRKPYSREKFKLNFEHSTLLSGWDVNKESDNAALLFRKGSLYYLGVMDKKHNRVFQHSFDTSEPAFEKVEYKLLPGPNKMLPKVFFSRARMEEFAPSPKVIEIYKRQSHKKGSAFRLEDCHTLIDFFKESLQKHEDWKSFNFHFSDTKDYQDISEFYAEVAQQGYVVNFRNIPEAFIHRLVETGKLYLFQIYNKDFSTHSKGTPNLHTLYWKMLFDPENLKDVVYKLNGQAEMFYRRASIDKNKRVVHKAYTPIESQAGSKNTFAYDIVKDRRFTKDSFRFHVPITLNFKAKQNSSINSFVNQHLKTFENPHIIGLSRGVKHLFYMVVINNLGKIVEQLSLNEIINSYKNKRYSTDYYHLLQHKEGSQNKQRKDWKTIENIKELKLGYASQVVHAIGQLMVKYNAVVVLEDLNYTYGRTHYKLEKQVCQKFQKLLVDKLNYWVDKKKAAGEPGGVLHALQLSSKTDSYKSIGKQSGFLFFLSASNTRNMDPVTGFVNRLDTRYSSVDKARAFIQRFTAIHYNAEEKNFIFRYSDMHFQSGEEDQHRDWILVLDNTLRYTYNSRSEGYEEIKVAWEMELLLQGYDIDYTHGNDLVDILSGQRDKSFFTGMLKLLSIVLNMCYSQSMKMEEFILSPVADSDGSFYDSRKGDATMPVHADANGAYNLARKGLLLLQKIRTSVEPAKLKPIVPNQEWISFAQQKPYAKSDKQPKP